MEMGPTSDEARHIDSKMMTQPSFIQNNFLDIYIYIKVGYINLRMVT